MSNPFLFFKKRTLKFFFTSLLLLSLTALLSQLPSRTLTDSRIKGNWKISNSEFLINIQKSGSVHLTSSKGERTSGYWRSNISGGKIPKGEIISFFMSWNKYRYGLSNIRFESNDTMHVKLDNTNYTLIRQENDYALNFDDHPDYWDKNIQPPQFITGKWYGWNSNTMIEFKENGTLFSIDKYGSKKESTWEFGKSYMHEEYSYIEVFPIRINCCYDETLFEIYNSGCGNYTKLRYKDSRGRSHSYPLWKDIKDNKKLLSVRQLKNIKKYFTGVWMTNENFTFLSANHGINLKGDGTFTTELSLGGSINSSFGKSGKWSISYEERMHHKTLYLDLYTFNERTIHPVLRRLAINIESINEDGFVSWEVTTSINAPFEFKRIKSFDEIYSESNGAQAATILLGLVVAKSIVEGITEEESAKNFSSTKNNSDRLMKIWREQDAKEKRY